MQNALLGDILNNIVMQKAVRDKIIIQQKQQRQQQARKRKQQARDQFDQFDDQQTRQIMKKMKMERLQKIQQQPIKQRQQKRTIGQYRQIMENQFLNYVTKLKYTVVHFYHKQFQRCKIMDKHLKLLSQQFPNTQFLYIDAQKSPFFVQKLSIRTLPTLCLFIDGILKDKILGFDGLSGDQFLTYQLANRISQSGLIENPKLKIKDKTLIKGGKRNNQSDSQGQND